MARNSIKAWRLFVLACIAIVNAWLCKGSKDIPVDIILTDYGANNIVKLHVNSSSVHQTTLVSSISPVSIAYDEVETRLYWTEYKPYRIRSSDVNGQNILLVKTLPTSSRPYGLAIGPISRKLFFTDWSRDVISSLDMNGENFKSILDSSKVKDPHQVTVHERERIIIWSDKKSGHKISTSNYDGTDIKRIVSVKTYAYGLALDADNDILYWTESSSSKVSSIFLNGTNVKVIFKLSGKNLYDIFLLGNTLYFSARRDRVRRMLTNGSNVVEIQSTSTFKYAHGLVVLANKSLESTTTKTSTTPSTTTTTSTTTITTTAATTTTTTTTTTKPTTVAESTTSEPAKSSKTIYPQRSTGAHDVLSTPSSATTTTTDSASQRPPTATPEASAGEESDDVIIPAVGGGVAAFVVVVVVLVVIALKVVKSWSANADVPADNSLAYKCLLKDETVHH